MRRLHDFTITRKEKVKESKTERNDEGQEVTTTTEVENLVDYNYFLQKPGRKLFEGAELFYAVQLSEGIKAGLLTRPLLAKRFNNDGGVLSDDEKSEFQELYDEIFEKQVEAQVLALKPKDSRTEEEEEEYTKIKEFLIESRKKLQEFELARSTLYDQTAENRARNKCIFWWVLHLSHIIDKEGNEIPFFSGETLDEKMDRYDQIEEEDDEYEGEVVQKFFYYTSFWYVSKTNDTEELKKLLEMAENEDLTGLEETEALANKVSASVAGKVQAKESGGEKSDETEEELSQVEEEKEESDEIKEEPNEDEENENGSR